MWQNLYPDVEEDATTSANAGGYAVPLGGTLVRSDNSPVGLRPDQRIQAGYNAVPDPFLVAFHQGGGENGELVGELFWQSL